MYTYYGYSRYDYSYRTAYTYYRYDLNSYATSYGGNFADPNQHNLFPRGFVENGIYSVIVGGQDDGGYSYRNYVYVQNYLFYGYFLFHDALIYNSPGTSYSGALKFPSFCTQYLRFALTNTDLTLTYNVYNTFVPTIRGLYQGYYKDVWGDPPFVDLMYVHITNYNGYYINTTLYSTHYYYRLASYTYYKTYSGSIYQKQTSAYSRIYSGSKYTYYNGRSYRYNNLYS